MKTSISRLILEKGVFRVVMSVWQRKNSESRFRAPMLYSILLWAWYITKFIWHASCILLRSGMSIASFFKFKSQHFASHTVDVSFVRHELSKLKLSKASGLDKIPAKLFKDSLRYSQASHLSYEPSQWKEAKLTPIYKTGKEVWWEQLSSNFGSPLDFSAKW